MTGSEGSERMTVPQVATLLGLTPNSVYRLVEEGQLGRVQVYEMTATGRPRRRRSFNLTRQDVDDFLGRARVEPGTLGYLYAPPMSPPELELRIIERFVGKLKPPPGAGKERLRYEVTRRGTYVTLWERRLIASGRGAAGGRTSIAQLRYDPPESTWTLYWADGRRKWHSLAPTGERVTLREVLDIIEIDAFGIFSG